MNLRLVCITLAATAAFAQGPGRFHMQPMAAPNTTALQSYLNLTDAQISSLQQLRQAEITALKPIHEQSGPLRQSLRNQEQSSSADAAEVGKLVLSLQSLEQQAGAIRASYQQEAMAVLTAVQKTQLAALQSAAALMPTIHQATALNLLARPSGPEGSGAKFQ